MAKQTFTVGQVLSAAQMTDLQATAMGGGSPIVKTASYVLVAADAGTVIQMNSASSTTITVNTALFAAGDSVQIQNIGAGVCTVTAGTATVTTAGSLALSQWEGGQLYFTSTSASIFFDIVQSSGMTNPLTTTGDTIYSSSGTTPARLGIGSTGQVLTVASGLPSWATPAGGGGMTLLSTTTLSGSSTSVTGISGSYKDLKILLYNINLSSSGTLTIQLNGSNSVSYTNQVMRLTTSAILEQLYASNWRLNGNGVGSSNTSNCFSLTVSNYANEAATTVKPYFYFGGYTDDGPRSSPIFGGGYFESTSAITSLNVAISAGSFSAGTIKVYGVN